MKIGLIDVDKENGKFKKIFPNIALMKFSYYHKNKGDQVEWYSPFSDYDIVYVSKVFDDELIQRYVYPVENAKTVYYGGYGYKNYDTSFIPNYEKLGHDYSIYNIENKAYGFLTKGCPRNCKFCVVGEIDGTKSVKVAELKDWYKGEKEIVINDPNILACKEHMQLLKDLKETNAVIEFNQGIDIKLMNVENTELLKNMKIKSFHFAWDNPKEDLTNLIRNVLGKLTDNKYNNRSKYIFYILTNFNSTFEEDIYRVEKIKELGASPFIMLYDKSNASKKHKHYQRYVNNNFLFRSGKSFTEIYPQYKENRYEHYRI